MRLISSRHGLKLPVKEAAPGIVYDMISHVIFVGRCFPALCTEQLQYVLFWASGRQPQRHTSFEKVLLGESSTWVLWIVFGCCFWSVNDDDVNRLYLMYGGYAYQGGCRPFCGPNPKTQCWRRMRTVKCLDWELFYNNGGRGNQNTINN